MLTLRPRDRRKNLMKMVHGEISGKKWKWMELAEDVIVQKTSVLAMLNIGVLLPQYVSHNVLSV